ncbi:uncharacterized protein N7511_001988 [Penicillium nucicola]|uniref:uncharacterized protein n=1 Tax=Penicillium nucicola TaxID=1850975 RepID=UPI0025452AFB|nr:uncharacterized protein N7511_001988 [Penicillium nucicola]KAJ5769937.1 hypothetical protein N7511_001988 [Penicillium nucicola]
MLGRKFAKPPVKVACLNCRVSRIRCDGRKPCSLCTSKGKECSYVPSRRGGPRKKRPQSHSPEHYTPHDDAHHPESVFDTGLEKGFMFDQFDFLSVPAAGLHALDPMDLSPPSQPSDTAESDQLLMQTDSVASHYSNFPKFLVRTYGSEPQILNAYYDFIHNYFPILPPRVSPPMPDQPIEDHTPYTVFPPKSPAMLYVPQSPLSLAISAILALIPHPEDPEPLSESSVIQRRAYAHTFATLASSKAEEDLDYESSCDLSQALPNQQPSIPRGRFHDHTSVELESLLALLVLSVYEYAQRGNVLKMKSRAGQALSIAMGKSLDRWMVEDGDSEARRRAWWMTYYCFVQCSIVNATPLTITINDPEFKTPYPTFSSDKEGWSILIQTQQLLVSATQYITDLDRAISFRTSLNPVFQEMQRLDTWAKSLLVQVDQLPTLADKPDGSEYHEIITAKSVRAMSRIKLSSAHIKIHRFRAFSDIPIFIKKHCDLAVAYTDDSNTQTDGNAVVSQAETENPSCSCSSLKPFQNASSVESSFQSVHSNPVSSTIRGPFLPEFPYSVQESTRICYRAAITISKMFESLPIPHPLQKSYRQQLIGGMLPRTMPSFACCLMQSSYAMLMLFYKARVGLGVNFGSGSDQGSTVPSHAEHITELRNGLRRTITAAANYSQAFEALNGMKGKLDEIRGAYETAFPEDFVDERDAGAISANSSTVAWVSGAIG